MTGTDSINGIGNELDNVIIGNAADNTLVALEGDAVLLMAGMCMMHAANDVVIEIRRVG